MKTMYIGTYTEPEELGVHDREIGVRIYLHRLDEDRYVLGDDIEGRCFQDVPIPTEVAEKIVSGELRALADTNQAIARFVRDPHFIFANSRIYTTTDPSLLTSNGLKSQYSPTVESN